MQIPETWVIPSEISVRDLEALRKVLASEGIEAIAVLPAALDEQLDNAARPLMVIVRARQPSIEVLEFVRRIAEHRLAAVVILDDLSEEREVMLLRSGALDVVGLPISTRLLSARIMRVHDYLAERGGASEYEFAVSDLLLRPAFREVWVGDRALALTKTEYRLLSAFIRDPRRVLTRDELVQLATGARPVGSHALESHLSRLRSKIRAAGGRRVLSPVRGVGYRLLSEPPAGWAPGQPMTGTGAAAHDSPAPPAVEQDF